MNADLEPLKFYFSPAAYTEYADPRNGDPDRKRIRNEIIYGRIAAYDAEFSQFQIDISRERSLADATGDSIIAMATAAGTGFSAKATKTALSGIGAAVTGIKGAVDKDIFFDQAMASLFSYMDSNRKNILADIIKGTALPVTDYPLTQGISDTLKYRDAGSIPNALAAIAEQTTPAKKKANDNLRAANLTVMRMRLNVR